MRTQEKLIYTNERGESIEFSSASSYHVNFKDTLKARSASKPRKPLW